MTWTLDTILRASVILAAGLGVAAALRNRPAALRHAVLAGAIFGSGIVPFASLLPAIEVPVSPVSLALSSPGGAEVVPNVSAQGQELVADSRGVSPLAWTILWLGGCVVVFAALAADAVRLRRVALRSRPLHDGRWIRCADELRAAFGIRTAVPLLLTATHDILATSGILRPRVLLPATALSWSDERIRVVLRHELAHVRRRDWAVQIAAELIRAACWFNPLIWIACTRLRRESESACDDAVVAGGVAPTDYAVHLLDIARACRRSGHILSAMTMARASPLHRRIAAMLNSQIDHRPIAPRRIAWIGALVFAAAVSVVALQARQAGPAQLTGTTYDATGAVLPGVAVTLRDATGIDRTAVTDAAGRFEFQAVAAGQYRLATSLAGFRPLNATFELRNAADWDRVITLQIANVQETINVRATRVAPAQAVPSQSGQPVRVGGSVRAPTKLVDVRPVYPAAMREAGREGVVPLEAVIRRDGLVGSVRVLSAEVHPDFAIAAVEAVRQWRFSPTLLNGQPVEVVMTVSITFSLAN